MGFDCWTERNNYLRINSIDTAQDNPNRNSIKKVNRNLETISKQLDKISEGKSDLKNISITTDSIAVKTKEILKTIEKQKTK